MVAVAYELDKKNGKRLEIVEDFTTLETYFQGNLPKYTIVYEPLFRISPQGVKTFSGYYEVLKVNGNETQIGIVSKDYRPISTKEEVEYLLHQLKENGKTEKDLKLKVSVKEFPKVNITFKDAIVEVDITPYETLAGMSFLHGVDTKIQKEKLLKGLEIINSYTGEIANSILGFWYRFICSNGLTEKGLGVSFRHSFIYKKVSEIIKKVAFNITKAEYILTEKPQTLMTPVEDDLIFEVRKDLERYAVNKEIISEYYKEIDLIKEVRKGIVPKWDFINVLTALATHRVENKFYLARKLQNKAYYLLSTITRN